MEIIGLQALSPCPNRSRSVPPGAQRSFNKQPFFTNYRLFNVFNDTNIQRNEKWFQKSIDTWEICWPLHRGHNKTSQGVGEWKKGPTSVWFVCLAGIPPTIPIFRDSADSKTWNMQLISRQTLCIVKHLATGSTKVKAPWKSAYNSKKSLSDFLLQSVFRCGNTTRLQVRMMRYQSG